MKLKLITAPTTAPAWLNDISDHLRGVAEDDLLAAYRDTAVSWVEDVTGLQMLTATYEGYLDKFETHIRIPRPPLQSITSITYFDANNTEQRLSTDDYYLDNAEKATPARVYIPEIPTTYNRPNAVKITFVAGFGDSADVPERGKQIVRMLVADLYRNRESQGKDMFKNETYEALLNSLKVWYA